VFEAAIILLLLAVLALVLALRLRRRTGLPWQRVVASDTGSGSELQKPLFSRRYSLTGKPDYLLQRGSVYIPVEVKPGRQAQQPYESDLMQLAAYCLLIEDTTGQAPPYGLLRYAQHTFRLNYTPTVRDELLSLLDEMHDLLDEDDCSRSHDDPRRCMGCSFVEVCDESLVE
jgi:CRISPR-associated exonuclease Cas4